MAGVSISAETTPNPNALKFNVTHSFFGSGSVKKNRSDDRGNSSLLNALFEIPEINEILIGVNFVSVTKSEKATWSDLAESCVEKMKEALHDPVSALGDLVPQSHGGESDNDSELVKKIKQVLDDEIRPAVAADGGDIVFQDFKDGVVSLHLQGACSTCPSSIMTLKMGVENRLRSLFPEIQEVIQV